MDYRLSNQHVLAEHPASRCHTHPSLLLGRLKSSCVIKQQPFGEREGGLSWAVRHREGRVAARRGVLEGLDTGHVENIRLTSRVS